MICGLCEKDVKNRDNEASGERDIRGDEYKASDRTIAVLTARWPDEGLQVLKLELDNRVIRFFNKLVRGIICILTSSFKPYESLHHLWYSQRES